MVASLQLEQPVASEDLFVLEEYFPAEQAVHVPPFSPQKPPLHTQPEMTVVPADDFELAGQAVHGPPLGP